MAHIFAEVRTDIYEILEAIYEIPFANDSETDEGFIGELDV